jgi:hypothetical protein
VGLHSKTFVLLRGGERKRTSLGKYPATSLKTARSKALSIIDGTFALQARPGPGDPHQGIRTPTTGFPAA